jgi:hypothetical protein
MDCEGAFEDSTTVVSAGILCDVFVQTQFLRTEITEAV